METPNIWQLQARRDVAGLVKALNHLDPDIRKRAAAALRALDASEAVPALEKALAAEKDWQAQANISAALQHLTGQSRLDQLTEQGNLEGLFNMLHSPNLDDVINAANALGDLGDKLAVEPLVTLFRNALMPDKARLAAAEALIKLKSAPTAVTLLAALRRDDWQVRRNAAAVLGQLQATWATDALIAALSDASPVVQRTALAALKNIGTPAAISAAEDAEAAFHLERVAGNLDLEEPLPDEGGELEDEVAAAESLPPPQDDSLPDDEEADENSGPAGETEEIPPEAIPMGERPRASQDGSRPDGAAQPVDVVLPGVPAEPEQGDPHSDERPSNGPGGDAG